jgi:hypothetical protein
MQTIPDYLVKKQTQFAQHPLFKKLIAEQSLEQFATVASHLSFWVMSFQDLLRLNQERITSLELRHIVRQHRLEDTGHEQWFLQDINKMRCKALNLRSLYSRNHAATRDATYALMSEVFQASSDYQRIALLLTLESASHVFFGFTVDFIDHMGYSTSLLYFSHNHLDCEKNHEIFAQNMEAYLAEIQTDTTEYKQILKMIDRVYNAFHLMFNGLQLSIEPNLKVSKMPSFALV